MSGNTKQISPENKSISPKSTSREITLSPVRSKPNEDESEVIKDELDKHEPQIIPDKPVVTNKKPIQSALEIRRKARSLSPVKKTTKGSDRPAAFNGLEMVEKSKLLVDSIKSPEHIFTDLYETNKNPENMNTQLYSRRKLKTLAKKLDIPVNLHQTDEVKKRGSFLRIVPTEYYKKLREIKRRNREMNEYSPQNHTNSISMNCNNNVLNESTLSYYCGDGLKNSNVKSNCSSPEGFVKHQRDHQDAIKLMSTTTFDITQTEKNLFFSPMMNMMRKKDQGSERVFRSTGNSKSRSINFDLNEYKSYEKQSMDGFKKDKVGSIMHKTMRLKGEIDEYMSRPTNDKRTRLNRDIHKMNLSELGMKSEIEEFFDKEERDLVMKNVDERVSQKYSALMRGFTKKKDAVNAVNIMTGNTNVFSYYRSLLVKEQRALDRIVLDPKFKKPRTLSHHKGRNLFG